MKLEINHRKKNEKKVVTCPRNNMLLKKKQKKTKTGVQQLNPGGNQKIP